MSEFLQRAGLKVHDLSEGSYEKAKFNKRLIVDNTGAAARVFFQAKAVGLSSETSCRLLARALREPKIDKFIRLQKELVHLGEGVNLPVGWWMVSHLHGGLRYNGDKRPLLTCVKIVAGSQIDQLSKHMEMGRVQSVTFLPPTGIKIDVKQYLEPVDSP